MNTEEKKKKHAEYMRMSENQPVRYGYVTEALSKNMTRREKTLRMLSLAIDRLITFTMTERLRAGDRIVIEIQHHGPAVK